MVRLASFEPQTESCSGPVESQAATVNASTNEAVSERTMNLGISAPVDYDLNVVASTRRLSAMNRGSSRMLRSHGVSQLMKARRPQVFF